MAMYKEVETRRRRGRGFSDMSQYDKHYMHESRRVPQVENVDSVPLKSKEGWILFITNLHEETTEDDLRFTFNEFGEVKNIALNLDRRTGFVKGYALVEYDSYSDAVTAKDCMHEADFLGMIIKVEFCFSTGPNH
ncbi:PREDICTED: RNA-binding protein 8A-like [Nicrophorus vespilloides]|uniref:RNA-binding protein 8A n=1 Tax=Nicrophorus vespilloides TaxID=110193 RepID=A0ABM1NJZ3_NICVS|nr:PREDICTED: RNA-binding protein 8A-like [Nicrophorus vespilloides]